MESRIIAGLVGGDMNAIDRSEHELHKASDVDLKGAWEDTPAPPVPVLRPFQKEFSYGRARGNTWGYQSRSKSERKRMDKFFYIGSIETVALNIEAQDVCGRVERLGIDLKTEIEGLGGGYHEGFYRTGEICGEATQTVLFRGASSEAAI